MYLVVIAIKYSVWHLNVKIHPFKNVNAGIYMISIMKHFNVKKDFNKISKFEVLDSDFQFYLQFTDFKSMSVNCKTSMHIEVHV